LLEPNAASVALLDGRRVLLIQRASEPLKGLWTLPGGRREAGESIEQTAAREVLEEVGLTVHALRPLLTMKVGASFLLQVFATQAFEGSVTPSIEVAGYRWTTPSAIGDLPTTPGLDSVLERAFALFEQR
jgi:acetyl-CoA carboxylase carboxyl transferase subunit beta